MTRASPTILCAALLLWYLGATPLTVAQATEVEKARTCTDPIGSPEFAICRATLMLNRGGLSDGKRAALLVVLGYSHHSLRQYDQAARSYSEAIASKPDEPELYFNRAMEFVYLGEYGRAIEDLTRAIHLAPKEAAAYHSRASAYRETGNTDSALRDWGKAIEMAPDFGEALVARGGAYYAQGQFEAAERDFDAASRLGPNDSALHKAMGRERFLKGHYRKAIADLERAVENGPGDPYSVIWLHLAMVRAGKADQSTLARDAEILDLSQ